MHRVCCLGGLPAALVARRPWVGPSGLRVAGGQAGPRVRASGCRRGRREQAAKAARQAWPVIQAGSPEGTVWASATFCITGRERELIVIDEVLRHSEKDYINVHYHLILYSLKRVHSTKWSRVLKVKTFPRVANNIFFMSS